MPNQILDAAAKAARDRHARERADELVRAYRHAENAVIGLCNALVVMADRPDTDDVVDLAYVLAYRGSEQDAAGVPVPLLGDEQADRLIELATEARKRLAAITDYTTFGDVVPRYRELEFDAQRADGTYRSPLDDILGSPTA